MKTMFQSFQYVARGLVLSSVVVTYVLSGLLGYQTTNSVCKAVIPISFESAEAVAQSGPEIDVTPAGCSAVRPDVVKIGEFLYLHILKTRPSPLTFQLVKLEDNLQQVYAMDIFSGHNPTDARIAADAQGFLWYSFETVYFDRSPNHFLNVARYDVSKDTGRPVLNAFQTELASGFFAQPDQHPAAGSELMDDPGPFFYKGRYYILTKTYASPQIYIRCLSEDLSVKDTIRIDLHAKIGDYFLSPGVLTVLENKVYLITGIANGPSFDPRSSSRIVAIELSDDLKQPKGTPILLTSSSDFASYVSSVRHRDGRTYVLYNVFTGRQDAMSRQHEHIGKLGIFDSKSLKPLNTVEINRGIMPDNHMAMEMLGDSICIFYNTPAERIMVKQLKLNEL